MEINLKEEINAILENFLEVLEIDNISLNKHQEYLILISHKQLIITETIFELLNKKNPDINSIVTLTRLIIENYLVNYFLHFEKVTSDEKEYRHLLYKYCGLFNRNKYTTKEREELEVEKKKNNEELEEIKSLISQNLFYKKLNPKNFPIKIFDKIKYFEKTDINNDAISTFWRLFSNYAHSEYISIINYITIKNDSVKEKLILDICSEFLIYINLKLKKNIQILFKEKSDFFQPLFLEVIFDDFEDNFLASF